jgi:hypothetical protein
MKIFIFNFPISLLPLPLILLPCLHLHYHHIILLNVNHDLYSTIKEHKMGTTRSTYERDEKCHTSWTKRPLIIPNVDGKTVLNLPKPSGYYI